jgi:hypothetical protein
MLEGTVPELRTSDSQGGEPFMVPPNMYFLRFKDVAPAPENGNRNPEWGPSWRWEFEVAEQDGRYIMSENPGPDGKPTPKVYWAYTSTKLGMTPAKQKAKARQYFEALLDREVGPGESLHDIVTECQGKVAQALLTHKKNAEGTKTNCVIAQMLPVDPETAAKIQAKAAASKASDEVPF